MRLHGRSVDFSEKVWRVSRKFALNSSVPVTGMKDPSQICD
jgi:hypothetical protein